MVSFSWFDVAVITNIFDIDSVSVYNLINVGRHVMTSDMNTFNFWCEIGIRAKSRNCNRGLKITETVHEACDANHATLYIFRCDNK